eukprot:CAMPEP_0175829070 /NCGR_PEP_ID=MMETSP0107_2-20121207/13142_1 /TAXON_ID=195067 ORGANISM="Goniomonas pacifica, Strain CCMP1869" /NCGR_SAMPLE_ID=MMETSP0107_2 /ASSEMBLY_ACC=CAM_ASM_000203 /LENGTH=57 /DNA_ID=CAMNT_0017141831 /DNA_START=143 /DNA_END=316 /DNA_ORIENTATION=-
MRCSPREEMSQVPHQSLPHQIATCFPGNEAPGQGMSSVDRVEPCREFSRKCPHMTPV